MNKMEPVCFGQPEGRKKGGEEEGALMKGPGPMEGVCGAALEVTAPRFRTPGLLGVKTRVGSEAGRDPPLRHPVIELMGAIESTANSQSRHALEPRSSSFQAAKTKSALVACFTTYNLRERGQKATN